MRWMQWHQADERERIPSVENGRRVTDSKESEVTMMLDTKNSEK